MERTILADCCEDWILTYGPFQEVGESFRCPECATPWRKQAIGEFRRESDGRLFVRRRRAAEDTEFPYLAAADGEEPITERCCAKILLRYGQQMRPGEFGCPVCRTVWHKEQFRRGGIPIATFSRPGLPEPIVIQPGPTRSYLVPLSSFTLPVE